MVTSRGQSREKLGERATDIAGCGSASDVVGEVGATGVLRTKVWYSAEVEAACHLCMGGIRWVVRLERICVADAVWEMGTCGERSWEGICIGCSGTARSSHSRARGA